MKILGFMKNKKVVKSLIFDLNFYKLLQNFSAKLNFYFSSQIAQNLSRDFHNFHDNFNELFSSPFSLHRPQSCNFIFLLFWSLYTIIHNFSARRPLRLPLKWIKSAANQFSAIKCDTFYAFARFSGQTPHRFQTLWPFCVGGIFGIFLLFYLCFPKVIG